MDEKIKNLRGKANQLRKEKKWVELIPVATKLIGLEEKPHDQAVAHYYLGFAYTIKDELTLALDNFDKAVELNPEYADAYCFLGKIYFRRKQYRLAFNNFEAAIKHGSPDKFYDPVVYIASQISVMDNLKTDQKITAFEIYSMSCITVWVIRQELFCEEKSEIAHYTSLHVLKTLSNARNHFRLYNTDYMNDPEEGQIFFKIMSEYWVDTEGDIAEWFYKDKESYRSPAYIGSFVQLEEGNKQKDKLFLWRTYGKHNNEEAAGACLIFSNKECFSEYVPLELGFMDKNLVLYEIRYREELGDTLKEKLEALAGQLESIKQFIENVKAERIRNTVRQFLDKNDLEKKFKEPENQFKEEKFTNSKVQEKNKAKDDLEKITDIIRTINKSMNNILQKEENKTEGALRRLVCELLDSIRFLFKENHYSEEKEVRVIQLRYGEKDETSESKVEVDAESIPPRFYVEAPENFRFNEVILGPRTERYQEWEQWLKAEAKKQDRSIDIKRSKIKYGKS